MPSAYIENRYFGVFGEQRNRGLELSLFGNLVRGVRLLGGLTLLDAERRRTAGGINQGNNVIGVPKTQLNIGGEWDVNALPGLSMESHRPRRQLRDTHCTAQRDAARTSR
jgi:iron complex outermembrane receptor protein